MSEQVTPDVEPEPQPAVEPEPDSEPDEEQDEEPGAEPVEPVPPAAPAPPETEALLEERGKKFELLTKHVAKRTGEIVGDDIELIGECPLCTYWGMPGWIPTVQPPVDLTEALYHYLGSHAPSDYARDQYSRACDRCNGLGEVLTGSKVPGQDRLPCIDCQARGWIAVGNERTVGPLSLTNGLTVPTVPASPAEQQMQPEPVPEPASVADLRAQGYVVVPPIKV